MMRDDLGQIHTIEGVTAAILLVAALLYVTSSITFVAPQTEKSVDMNLSVMGTDILTALNAGDQDHVSELKMDVLAWNNGTIYDTTMDPAKGYPTNESSIASLDRAIGEYLPAYEDSSTQNKLIRYSVSFFYKQGPDPDPLKGWANRVVISHGTPYDNAMTVSKLITLNPDDDQLFASSTYAGGMARSSYWNDNFAANGRMPLVVEVRLSLWYA